MRAPWPLGHWEERCWKHMEKLKGPASRAGLHSGETKRWEARTFTVDKPMQNHHGDKIIKKLL